MSLERKIEILITNIETGFNSINKSLNDITKQLKIYAPELSSNKQLKAAKPKSLKEFLIEKNPSSDVNKALVIGYYLEFNKNLSSFTGREIEKGFQDCREKIPNNMSLCMYKNTGKGFFSEVEEKNDMKAYELTNSGIKFVENGLKMD